MPFHTSWLIKHHVIIVVGWDTISIDEFADANQEINEYIQLAYSHALEDELARTDQPVDEGMHVATHHAENNLPKIHVLIDLNCVHWITSPLDALATLTVQRNPRLGYMVVGGIPYADIKTFIHSHRRTDLLPWHPFDTAYHAVTFLNLKVDTVANLSAPFRAKMEHFRRYPPHPSYPASIPPSFYLPDFDRADCDEQIS